MDETPKKVIRSEFLCFLCSRNLGKDQGRVFRKSAVDIARLIKRALDVDVSLYSQVNYLFDSNVLKKSQKRYNKAAVRCIVFSEVVTIK